MKVKMGESSLNLRAGGSLASIERGPRGYSAYEVAVQNGFEGSESAWLASLVGAKGDKGDPGNDGERGVQGPRGQQGIQGETGDTGETGPSNVLSIGSVTKGDEANATITGESPNQILNLVLPKGDKGDKGDTGNKGDTGARGPQGIQGVQGPKGDKGDTGNDGYTPVKGVDYFTSEDIASLNIPDSLSDLSDDSTHRTVTDAEKSTWNNKYDKPSGGIPATDLSEQVQTSLGKADTALQEHQSLDSYYTKTETDTLLNTKQNTLTFDTTPVENSTNPVTSGGIYTSQEEQDTNIQLLQTLVNQMPTVEATGTDISLQDVLNYRFMKFVMKGNSSQFSTTGKQLFNKDHADIINASVTSSNINSSANARTLYISITGGETYTISKIQSSRFRVGTTESLPANGVSLTGYQNMDSNTTTTITTDSNAQYLCVYYYLSGTDTLTEQQVLNSIMIEKGSSPSNYEPYTGGIPAPNPSYPYPVKTVTGENSLVICNENLFDNGKPNTYFNSSKQFDTWTGSNASTTNFIQAKENDVYTIKSFETSSGVVIASFDENFNCLQRQAINGTTLTYTCPANTKYIIGSNYIGMSAQTMLVKGSTAPSTYIAHQSQTYPLSLGTIELCSTPDGTVSDEIVGSPNNWVKREYIGKVVLDGSETWYDDNDNAPYRTNISGSVITTSNNLPPQIWINNFQKTSYNSTWSSFDSVVTASEKANPTRLKFRYTAVNNLEEFKTWLSTHNSTVYYVRANYQDIPITDTTLISQLNNIYNTAHSYNGTTNVTSTYASGNEQMIIEAGALSDIFKQIQSNTNAILEIGGE